MGDYGQFSTPILFLIFNRPDLTKTVFERIRVVKPKYLFIAADGPRDSNPDDKLKCEQSRKVSLDYVDWDCEIKTLFRGNNLGCGLAVSQAISWFFDHVEEGIILEDDCYPDSSFFEFCRVSLSYYRKEKKVMHISGSNFQLGKRWSSYSCYFTKYTHVWGWATWKESWEKYKKRHIEFELKQALQKYGITSKESKYWIQRNDDLINGIVNTWDYQWQFSVWENGGISVNSNYNLILNLGLHDDSTHSIQNDNFSKLELENMSSRNLLFSNDIVINDSADKYVYNNFYTNRIVKRIFRMKHLKTIINLKL